MCVVWPFAGQRMRFELYDWLGLADRHRVLPFMRGLARPSHVVEEEG